VVLFDTEGVDVMIVDRSQGWSSVRTPSAVGIVAFPSRIA